MGVLIFVMGFSTIWIMWGLYARVAELDRCVSALCNGLDELRLEVMEFDKHDQERNKNG